MSSDLGAHKLLECILMLKQLEEFTGVDLSHARETARMVYGAYTGNAVDTQTILDLKESKRVITSKERNHVHKFSRLRIVEGKGLSSDVEFIPSDFPCDLEPTARG